MKVRRSEWRGSHSNRRSQRIMSPLMTNKRGSKGRKRPYRPSGHRSGSGELPRDDLSRDHSLPPQHWSHRKSGHRHCSLPPPDDDFTFQQHCISPDHQPSKPGWRGSPPTRSRDFYSPMNETVPSSSLDIVGRSMLPQKPSFMEKGPLPRLYSDQPESTSLLNLQRSRASGISLGMKDNDINYGNDRQSNPCGDSIGTRIEDNEMYSYYDLHRDQYGNMGRKQLYPKDSFPRTPPSHLRGFSNGSSSSIVKEKLKGLHHDDNAGEFATAICRHPNDHMEHLYYRQVPESDSLRRNLPNEPPVYAYGELYKRVLDDQHCGQDELYKRIPRSLQRNAPSTVLDHKGDWMEKGDSPNRSLIKRTFSDRQDSLFQGFSHDYHHVGPQQELLTNSDNYYDGLRIKLSRDYETIPFKEGVAPEKEYFPLSHRDDCKIRPPLLSDHELDEHRLAVRACTRSHLDDLRDYDVEILQRRNVSINGDVDTNDPRVAFVNERVRSRSRVDDLRDYDIERMQLRNISICGDLDKNDPGVAFVNDRRPYAPYGGEEMWLAEGPKSMLSERSSYQKTLPTIFASDTFMPSRAISYTNAKNDHNTNVKRRLKHTPYYFNNSSFSERRQDIPGPYKYRKKMHDRLGAQGGGTHESDSHLGKNDPPEDSEEFKQQVHKAFLRFCKLLNESPHNRRIYQNQGKVPNLLCSVCGSSSKEFVDTNSLVIHTYHSLKVGLKTEHLGFHKALCVLLGWNWRVPPDSSRAYQSIPVAEAKALQEDLILWPPLVIIHNSLITDNIIAKDAKVITVEVLEKILKDKGFSAGIRVSIGNPANKSIFAVKFFPTFSGLQEAQKLHDHFSAKNRGKHEFQQLTSSRNKSRNADLQSDKIDEILYGYMAVAEDLTKLDNENKKRALVKSKTDIQAIADAPLNAD